MRATSAPPRSTRHPASLLKRRFVGCSCRYTGQEKIVRVLCWKASCMKAYTYHIKSESVLWLWLPLKERAALKMTAISDRLDDEDKQCPVMKHGCMRTCHRRLRTHCNPGNELPSPSRRSGNHCNPANGLPSSSFPRVTLSTGTSAAGIPTTSDRCYNFVPRTAMLYLIIYRRCNCH